MIPAFPQVSEETEMILDRNDLGLQISSHLGGEAGRQTLHEVLIGLVNQAVLIPQRIGV
jgi:hypothetical protein